MASLTSTNPSLAQPKRSSFPDTRSISHLVGPLSHSYAVAGFFPKSIEPLESSGLEDDEAKLSSDDEQDSVYNQSKYWLIEDDGLAGGSEGSTGNTNVTGKLNKQFLRCTQTMNLRKNFLYWDAKSKEKQQNQPPARQQSSDQQDDRSTKTDKQD